ncbi:MAG TPA: CHRD domain-containing protein [Caulobacteraceae bacterium]|nr:CHRD domain-containing protein [Caulobacteraceae bacterium]
MRIAMIIAAGLGAAAFATAAAAETVHFQAKLDGAQETPPHAVPGKGSADVSLDTATKKLSWRVTYSGLTGPAVAAHFHGPAGPGKAAGVQVPLTGNLASPITGSADISDAQIKDLRAGLWYLNIHTAQYPPGEIRGQVLPVH